MRYIDLFPRFSNLSHYFLVKGKTQRGERIQSFTVWQCKWRSVKKITVFVARNVENSNSNHICIILCIMLCINMTKCNGAVTLFTLNVILFRHYIILPLNQFTNRHKNEVGNYNIFISCIYRFFLSLCICINICTISWVAVFQRFAPSGYIYRTTEKLPTTKVSEKLVSIQ